MSKFPSKTAKHSQLTTIYLDQKDWLNLYRAYYGLENADLYKETLESLVAAVDEGRIFVLISSTNILEMLKYGDKEGRLKLCELFARISKGRTIAPHFSLIPYEIRNALNLIFAVGVPDHKIGCFGAGGLFAIGLSDEEDYYSYFGRTPDSEDSYRNFNNAESLGVFLEFFARFTENNELRGQLAEEERLAEVCKDRRKRNAGLNKMDRKRDYARNILADFENVMIEFGRLHRHAIDGRERDPLELISRVPTLDIECEFVAEREFIDKNIEDNDALDVLALEVAIPYCDIVVTEKFWAGVATRAQFQEKYKTIILRDINDLKRHI